MTTNTTYDLDRFLQAQRWDYAQALNEIRAGRKTGHWIWYVFPQQKGLGRSYNSQYYGLDGLEEAKAYYAHPVLRARLREITEAVLQHQGERIETIMGGGLDARKLRSCMELFDRVAPNDLFKDVLTAFYGVSDEGKPIVNSFKVADRFFAGEYPGDKTPEAAQSKLKHFLDKGFTHFIDLTEEGELSPYAQFLPDGVSYLRFPVPDISIPKDLASVQALIKEMDTILADPGNKLYLHCWGGVGRTGTIVGCWYANRQGTTFSGALQKTRDAFKGCPKSRHRHIPETPEQVSFIGEYSRAIDKMEAETVLDAPISALPYEYNLDKVKGCLVGGAVGDALGYTVEFLDYAAILSKFGPKGITRCELDRQGIAEFSDDTQMTLFTATGLLAAESELNLSGIGDDDSWVRKVAGHYIDWYWTQNNAPNKKHESWLFEIPELHACRAPGMTCLGSLRNLVKGIDQENNSKGCGGVMRVAPVALCNDLRESMGADFLYSLGGAVADLTHNNPLGFMPAALLVMLLDKITKCGKAITRKVLEKLVLESIDEIGSVRLRGGEGSGTYDQYPEAVGTLRRLMKRALDLASGERPDEECIRELGEGWTGEEALAIAVYCALRHTDSFEDAVVAAVNHSGDSDSTGAICGNMMGLIHGYDSIPAHFKEHLELLPVLVEVATDLYTGSTRTDDIISWKRKYLEGHRAD